MRYLWILICLAVLPACQQQRRVVHDNSASAKFLAMVGGKPTAGGKSMGVWQIDSSDQPRQSADRDPNVRVIKEADFSGYTFHTNFQIDDPAAKKPRTTANPPASTTQPASPFLPFGALPAR